MPIYDHICDHCGHAFSLVQKYSDDPVEKCPSCGKRPRRVMTAPAIVFKGSGWYKTDSRSSAASKEGSKSETAGESKPAETKPAETKPAETKPAEAKPAATP